MSKTLSLNFREELYKQESDEIPVMLVELRHPDTTQIIRISGDNTKILDSDPELQWGTVSQGKTYIYRPMNLRLPSDSQDKPPKMQIIVENVTGDLVAFCASMIQRGTCDLDIVLASQPDIIQIPFPVMDLRGYSRNNMTIVFEVGMDAAEDEPIPGGTFTPAGFPGLFV
jgi:Domain of unknown function (DUF1833)